MIPVIVSRQFELYDSLTTRLHTTLYWYCWWFVVTEHDFVIFTWALSCHMDFTYFFFQNTDILRVIEIRCERRSDYQDHASSRGFILIRYQQPHLIVTLDDWNVSQYLSININMKNYMLTWIIFTDRVFIMKDLRTVQICGYTFPMETHFGWLKACIFCTHFTISKPEFWNINHRICSRNDDTLVFTIFLGSTRMGCRAPYIRQWVWYY